MFGGKITTARHLAEEALGKLAPLLARKVAKVTRTRPFPGGDVGEWGAFLAQVRTRWPWLGEVRSARMAHAYGSALFDMLGDDVPVEVAGGLTEVELRWMHDREWARTVEDVLERRSKLGLTLTADERATVAAWWAANFPLPSGERESQ